VSAAPVPFPLDDVLAQAGPLDDRAEDLLARAARAPGAWGARASDLADGAARRAFRPLLACLARKSAQESGTDPDPYGGALAFVLHAPSGLVRLTGTFENTATVARLNFDVPQPCALAATPHGGSPIVDLLQPAVVDYWIEDTGFALASDLARLDRVRAAGAAESAALYCNRIVEAMARSTVGPTPRGVAPSLAGLISDLEKYHHLPRPLTSLLHKLRSLGNDARHAVQPVTAADVDVAFAVLLRWLQWAFYESASGPQLPALGRASRPTDALLPLGLARLVDDAATTGDEVLARLASGRTDGGALSPLLVAAAAEALLGRKLWDQARTVLNAGLNLFPRDRRLRQLLGLYWSRRGGDAKSAEHLHRARAELEPLLPQGGALATDEDTYGILGGVYKRLAELEPAAADQWLTKSAATYRAGWEQSRRTNEYLGINTATLAFFRGEDVRALAGPIRDRIEAVEARLRAAGHGPRPLTFWDQATWGTAELLLRNWAAAGELYRDAFARFPEHVGYIDVTVWQAQLILDRMGESARAADVLGR
jgi:Domain of unknown function (DUF4145)